MCEARRRRRVGGTESNVHCRTVLAGNIGVENSAVRLCAFVDSRVRLSGISDSERKRGKREDEAEGFARDHDRRSHWASVEDTLRRPCGCRIANRPIQVTAVTPGRYLHHGPRRSIALRAAVGCCPMRCKRDASHANRNLLDIGQSHPCLTRSRPTSISRALSRDELIGLDQSDSHVAPAAFEAASYAEGVLPDMTLVERGMDLTAPSTTS